MLPTSQEIAESALDLDEAMPLKSDSTARREPMMVATVKAARAAAAIRKRLTVKRRFLASSMAHLGACRAAHKRNRAERCTRNRGPTRRASSPRLIKDSQCCP